VKVVILNEKYFASEARVSASSRRVDVQHPFLFSMSATAKAKARREAILGARGDRLKKLTSSARGDDSGGVYDGTLALWVELKNVILITYISI